MVCTANLVGGEKPSLTGLNTQCSQQPRTPDMPHAKGLLWRKHGRANLVAFSGIAINANNIQVETFQLEAL